MASISPTSVQCAAEPFTTMHGYIKLTITSISDSDAATNQRYIGWKLTVEGTSWVQLSAYYCSLGGVTLAEKYTNTSSWTSGQILASSTATFNNDSSGNLSLYAYVKQLFYYGYSDARWWDANRYQDAGVTMYCSQLPRYANITSHSASSKRINRFTISWKTDVNVNRVRYKLGSGSWTTVSGSGKSGSYTITGLNPNTSYSIITEVRRSDNNLTTQSSSLSVKTAALPTSTDTSDINLDGTIVPSISSMTNLTNWKVKVYDGSTLLGTSSNFTATNGSFATSSYTDGMLTRHINDNFWNLKVEYYVTSDGTEYKLTDQTIKCTIPQNLYQPIFNENNISYIVTDSLSNNITGSNQKVIKGISDIQVTCTAASPQGHSNMKSYNATSGSKTASTTDLSSIVMNLVDVDGSGITVQAIDTRDRNTTVTKPFAQYVEYSKVDATLNIVRYDGIGQNLIFNIVGSFYKWSGLAVNNTIQSIQYQYKIKGQPDSSYSSPINITGITYNDNIFTVNSVGSGNHFDTDKEYTVKISITDRLTTVSYITDIPTGKALVWKDLANYNVGIGKKPEYAADVDGDCNISGNFRINGAPIQHLTFNDIYPIGSIYMSVNSTSPQTLFGGTWERIQGRFILAGNDSAADYQPGKTGGSVSKTISTDNLPAHTHGSKAMSGTIRLRGMNNGGNAGDVTGVTGGLLTYTHNGGASWNWGIVGQSGVNLNTDIIVVNATHEHTSVGKGTGLNIMPPFLAVYVWKRTA